MKISVVIHTLNSGTILRQCLEAVKNFDEIVICDMYSTDNTLSIAEEYNCKVVMHEPCGGIPEPARPFAIQSASNEWIFVVDSDEIVPPELNDYLYALIKTSDCPDGLWIPRKNFFMNKFMRSTFPDYQLRFFKKSKFTGWAPVIHSSPEINGRVDKIPAKEALSFIHLDKNRLIDMAAKMNTYTERDLARRKGKKESLAGLIFKPGFRFFKIYILKGGFRDGVAGFLFARMRAYAKFLIIAKMIERQELEKTKF